MAYAIGVHQGVIRPGLIAELETFRAAGQRVSSYYLNLDARLGNAGAIRIAVRDALAAARERIDAMDVAHAIRQALRRDWEQVGEMAPSVIGERHTAALACFVASDSRFGRNALRGSGEVGGVRCRRGPMAEPRRLDSEDQQ